MTDTPYTRAHDRLKAALKRFAKEASELKGADLGEMRIRFPNGSEHIAWYRQSEKPTCDVLITIEAPF